MPIPIKQTPSEYNDATLAGVVYDPQTLRVQQVIVPDTDSILDDPAWTERGRYEMLRLPIGIYFRAANRIVGHDALVAEFRRRMTS